MGTASVGRALWVTAAAGAVLRTAAALARPPWHDELFTAWIASLPLPVLVDALRLDSGPPLPYLLVLALARAGVPALLAARAVAVLAGTVAIVVAGRAAERAFGANAAVLTAALIAVHPLAVAWSSEGRAYPLVLLAAAGVWERLEALAAGERRAGVGLAGYLVLAVWSHGLGLALLGAALTAALTIRGPGRRTALAAIGAAAVSHLAWVPVAAAQPPAALAWMRGFWHQIPWPEQLLSVVRLLPPAAPFARTVDLPSAPPTVATAALVLVGFGLVVGASRPECRRALPLAAVPAAGLLLLALLGVPAVYPGRTEAVLLPAALGLTVVGLSRWRAGLLTLALLAAAGLTTSTVAVVSWARLPASVEARLARAVRSALPEGGRVVVAGHWKLGLQHHLGAAREDYRVEIFPPAAERHPGWYDPASEPTTPEAAATLQADLARDLIAGTDVALVLPPPSLQPPELRQVADRLGMSPVVTTDLVQLRARRSPRRR